MKLVAVQFVLQFIIDKPLTHQFANDFFDIRLLFKESIILTNFNLIILD